MSFQRSNPAAFSQANWTSELVGFCLRKDSGVCRARVKHKSGSCRREGRQWRIFPPIFAALLSLSVMESDNRARAAHLSCQGPHQELRAWSQGTEDLNLIKHGILQCGAAGIWGKCMSSPICMGKELCRPIFWGIKVHSNMCCMGGESLGGKGTVVMGGTGSGKALTVIFFPPLSSLPQTQIFLWLAKKGGSGVEGLPWMVFTSRRSTTVFLIKPSGAQPGAPCRILHNISHCFGGLS